MRARLRRIALHIKKQVTGVRGMRRYRNSGELRRLILFLRVFADRLFFLAHWERQMRAWMALVCAVRPDKLTIDIVIGRGLQFVPPRRDVFDLQVLEHQCLIAVIGNQQADWKKAMLPVILFEHPGHFLSVHRIGGNRNFFVVMRLMQCIRAGMVRRRRIEMLFAEKQRGEQKNANNDAGGFHKMIIQPRGGFAQPRCFHRMSKVSMYVFYSLLLASAALLSLPWWIIQMLRLGKYRSGLGERLGLVPARLNDAQPGSIWVHAVSVGEVLAVSQLINELQQQHPDRQIFVSTTTATGQTLARQRFGENRVFFMPLDFGFAVRRYLKRSSRS